MRYLFNSQIFITFAFVIEQLLKDSIVDALPFPPTEEQAHAIETFATFFSGRNKASAMILRGCAGTGKTTLASAIVKVLSALGQKAILLAPTGRAAKVFSVYSGKEALTIHRKIYRQKTFNGTDTAFTLDFNKSKRALFIIDESSMISNYGGESIFGSGRLLDDLIQYVYQEGDQCRILFMGDKAQLPPVGEGESPALSASAIESYGLEVFVAELNEVMRQQEESGILYNATQIRNHSLFDLPKIRLKGFADIQRITGSELIESLSNSYHSAGIDDTIVVTRSNKRANIYNQGIRRTVLDMEDKMCSGDMLMVVKNNYFWPENDPGCDIAFIANGDRAIVKRIRNEHQQYDFTFADVTLEFPDYDNYEMTMRMMFDTIYSESPALTHEQNEHLYQSVFEDYSLQPNHPKSKRKLLDQVKSDSYFNALQVKFAYAVTCHKAQGGQWAHVYLDQGYMTEAMLTEDYIHWLYTAFTRATEKLFLVNWPKEQIENIEN